MNPDYRHVGFWESFVNLVPLEFLCLIHDVFPELSPGLLCQVEENLIVERHEHSFEVEGIESFELTYDFVDLLLENDVGVF